MPLALTACSQIIDANFDDATLAPNPGGITGHAGLGGAAPPSGGTSAVGHAGSAGHISAGGAPATGGKAGSAVGGSAGNGAASGGTAQAGGAGGSEANGGGGGGTSLGGFGGGASGGSESSAAGAAGTGGTQSPGGTSGAGGDAGAPASCGNGIKEANEPCDGADFGTSTCASITGDSSLGGKLGCESCKIRTDGCSKNPTCGDGKVNATDEICDDGNTADGDACSADCTAICKGGKTYADHCYQAVLEESTWPNAQAICALGGGYLVTFGSVEEQAFVTELILPGTPESPDKCWMGLTDDAAEGQYTWVTGEPLTFSNWAGGEPNNAGNEDCVQLVRTCSFFDGCGPAGWADEGCAKSRAYVCEYPLAGTSP